MGLLTSIWQTQKHPLDRMTLRELLVAYFQYPAMQAYIGLLTVSGFLALQWSYPFSQQQILTLDVATAISILVYPLVWYTLHRFVAHGRFLYKSPRTAAIWKRIHYDHHREPHDLRVLFGALHTTLPIIASVTLPIGTLIGGHVGAAMALATGLATTLFYEFCHCTQHLRYMPRSAFLKRIKRLHLLHHFHNKHGNFGITNFFWDRIVGMYYNASNELPHSETAFNLGYANEENVRYPWVTRLSNESD